MEGQVPRFPRSSKAFKHMLLNPSCKNMSILLKYTYHIFMHTILRMQKRRDIAHAQNVIDKQELKDASLFVKETLFFQSAQNQTKGGRREFFHIYVESILPG